MVLNPATSLFVTSRSWLIGGEPPMYLAFSLVVFASVILLTLGVVMLKVALPHIIERISA